MIKELLVLKDVDASDVNKEEFLQKVDACFDSIIGDTTDHEYEHLRENVKSCGEQILELYGDSNGSIVQLDEQTNHFMQVFLALKAVVVPIIRPCSNDERELLNDMKHHDARVRSFEHLLTTDELELSFGEKSDYMHWMKFHAKEECERVIKRWHLHLSKFSCQTSEHFNKIMKRLVEKLHGFSSRSVSRKEGNQWKNKFGYIMQQFQIRYLHFYETFSSVNTVTCSNCGTKGHNVRTCEKVGL